MQPMQDNIFGKIQETPQIKHITGPEERKIMKTTASDIGIFSGKEKLRLELSNNELDPTHKFAIALFEEAVNTTDPNHKIDKKGVYVHLRKNDQGALMTDVADISSIAKRLGLSEDEVRKCANQIIGDHTKLDEKIQKIVDDYEKEVKAVKGFIGELKELSQNSKNFDKKETLPQIKEKVSDYIINKDNPLRKSVVDKGKIQTLLTNFYVDSYNSLNVNPDIFDFNAKLEEFEAKLAKLDKNFAPNVAAPREKITKDTTLWGKSTPNLLFNIRAKNVKDYPDYDTYNNKGSGKAVRLNIALHNDKNKKYAIKTDGYIYHEKPKASEKFIPYSEDDKTWVLLNINSLSDRTGIAVSDLQSADKINNLKVVLLDKMALNLITVDLSPNDINSDKPNDINPDKLNSVMDQFKNLKAAQLLHIFNNLKNFPFPLLKQRFIQERGNEAVCLAVQNKNLEVLKCLLENGANANTYYLKKVPSGISVKEVTYETHKIYALEGAILKKDVESIIELISRGANLDVEYINTGSTARQLINNNKDLHKTLEDEWIRRGNEGSFDAFLAAK